MIDNRGVKAKVFIPCIIGRCPERMQLVTRAPEGGFLDRPYYRCMRRDGFACLCSDDEYARTHCVVGDNINLSRWVTHDGDARKRKSDEPDHVDMETML